MIQFSWHGILNNILPLMLTLLGLVLFILTLLKANTDEDKAVQKEQKWAIWMSSAILLSGLALLWISIYKKDYLSFSSATITGIFSLLYGIFATIHDFKDSRQRLTKLGKYGILFMIFIQIYSGGIGIQDYLDQERISKEVSEKNIADRKKLDSELERILSSGKTNEEKLDSIGVYFTSEIKNREVKIIQQDEEIKKSKEEMGTLSVILSKRNQKIDDLQEHQKELKREYEANEKNLIAYNEELTKYNDKLNNYSAQLSEEMNELKEDIARSKSDILSEHKSGIESMTNNYNKLSQRYEALEKSYEEQKTKLEEIPLLKNKINAISKENDSLKIELFTRLVELKEEITKHIDKLKAEQRYTTASGTDTGDQH